MARRESVDALAEYEAWERWLDKIPPDRREQASALVDKYDLSTKTGMALYIGEIHRLTLDGIVSPGVAKTLQSLLKDQLTLIYLMHQETNSTARVGVTYRQVITEIQDRASQIRPTYLEAHEDLPELPDVMEAVPLLEADDE